ncbi:tetratricopeptide repeat protein [Clostridium perfringens]|uniref:tetratricopeptide repeat protein n=1 Tax=Clostridium perfringens TaxID=1502 RepID=UPI0017866E8A|nr:tetratricopeptide repeat protein [Clostridium perfringens]
MKNFDDYRTKFKRIESLLEKGDKYYNDRNFEKAIKIYEEALELEDREEKKAKIYNNIGDLYYCIEEDQKAINLYEKALNLDCTDELKSEIYNNMGILYYNKNKYEKAKKLYEEALKCECKDELRADVYNNIGNVYYYKSLYKEAIKSYEEALNLECTDEFKVEIYNNLGNSYYNNREYEEAIKEYENALNLGCTGELRAKIYNRIGNSYFYIRKYEESIREYKEALSLKCTDKLRSIIYNNIGNSHYNNGEYEEAIKEYKEALVLQCTYKVRAIIYNNIGNSYYNSGKYEAAIKSYDEALDLECTDELRAIIYKSKCKSYYNQGNKELTKKECGEAVEKILKLKKINNNKILYINLNEIYNLIYSITKEEKYLNEANKYLVKANDNKFYKYIDKMKFEDNTKSKMYKLFNNVIELRNAMIYKENNTVVGHYTRIGTLKYLIKSNIENDEKNLDEKKSRLRLNNVAYMNDPTEGEVFIELLLTKVKEDKKYKKFKTAQEFIKNLYITKSSGINREILNRKSSVFLTSFSKAIDTSLPMWVQYSDDGQGCCITIKSSFFDKEEKASVGDCFKAHKINNLEDSINSPSELDNENNNYDECYCLYEIQYLEYKEDKDGYYIEKDKDKKFQDLVKSLCDLREDIESNPDLKPIIQNILDQIRFLFKDKNYEHEKELRLIKFENNGKVKYTGENEGFIVPHVYIEMDKELEVEEVILGPKAKNPMEVATYLYYTDKVKQVSKSKIKYK